MMHLAAPQLFWVHDCDVFDDADLILAALALLEDTSALSCTAMIEGTHTSPVLSFVRITHIIHPAIINTVIPIRYINDSNRNTNVNKSVSRSSTWSLVETDMLSLISPDTLYCASPQSRLKPFARTRELVVERRFALDLRAD